MDNLQKLRERLESETTAIESARKVRRLPTSLGPTATGEGTKALDLVHHAAEVLRGIEDRANETEQRAKSIAERAIAELERAERRITELEKEQRTVEDSIAEAHVEIQETREALHLEKLRVKAAEDLVAQIELRTVAAETHARESENALARIEDAIRTQLLKGRTLAARSAAAA
jgi:chromosome segregation ATPase